MKFTESSAADEPEINVISLIDVILVLLIFFMATATFENQNRLKVNLPKASQNTTVADKSKSFVIQIDSEGRFFVGGAEVANATLDSLKTAIAGAAGAERNQRIMLRADGSTPHQSVITAMDAVSQLGFTNLSIATIKRSP
jgi:biopolymer transport protein ExbD